MFYDEKVEWMKKAKGPMREVFSCTKISPFVQSAFHFPNAPSRDKIKFKCSQKTLIPTPRVLQLHAADMAKKTAQVHMEVKETLKTDIARGLAKRKYDNNI